MTVRFQHSTTIAAPVETTFDTSLDVDFHRTSFEHTGEQIVAGISSGSMALGDTVTWRARHFGIWWTMTSEITEYVRPRHFVDEQQRGPFRDFRHEHRFVECDEGTEMHDIVTFDAPVPILGRIAETLVLRRHLDQLIVLRNHELKRILEGG